MPSEHLVVVGASLAGLRAVESARRGGFAGTITLIGAEEHVPYDRPPLSKDFLTAEDAPSATILREEAMLRDELGINLRLGTRATGLDTGGRTVLTEDGPVGYTSLVIATGASPRTLPGTEHLAGVHVLRTIDDARSIRAALDAGARTVVVGAGFIGSEIAASARARGLDVTVVEALPTPLARPVGEEMGRALAALHERHGTTLRVGVGVESLEGEDRVRGVRLADGTTLDADLVVVGIGVTPNVGWLADSGLTLADGVECDETLGTGVDGVYAAGDLANWINPTFGTRMRLEHWTIAAEQGGIAGRHAADPAAVTPYETVPYFWSDWYGKRIQFVGIAADADEIVTVAGDVDGDTFITLYRRGDRFMGALALEARSQIMKYRALLARRASWDEAMAFAKERAAKAAAAR
ncbi:MAG TPA: FAD/NAD(P)-binding oxidoreductase [Mycobacteriales bacterium]|jgi:NADPH-dependent 2,4-dienoyl-CoA reductase/sulfur reductase-like enzyme|nr:FAD/NAD(P)-binding oxidoreductase [Mycobacteriales bacterium]